MHCSDYTWTLQFPIDQQGTGITGKQCLYLQFTKKYTLSSVFIKEVNHMRLDHKLTPKVTQQTNSIN